MINVRAATKFEGVHYAPGVQNLADDLELRMVNAGVATFIDADTVISFSRPSRRADSAKDPLISTAASAITYTLSAATAQTTITESMRIRQDAAGVVTVSGDSSVQMVGAGGSVITSLATTGVGSMILIEPIDLVATPKRYLVIKGGA